MFAFVYLPSLLMFSLLLVLSLCVFLCVMDFPVADFTSRCLPSCTPFSCRCFCGTAVLVLFPLLLSLFFRVSVVCTSFIGFLVLLAPGAVGGGVGKGLSLLDPYPSLPFLFL